MPRAPARRRLVLCGALLLACGCGVARALDAKDGGGGTHVHTESGEKLLAAGKAAAALTVSLRGAHADIARTRAQAGASAAATAVSPQGRALLAPSRNQ